MRGDYYWDPPHLLPFLKSVEKGATTLVLFAYAMYAMLYLLLPSGVYILLPSGGLYSVMYCILLDDLSSAWPLVPA